MTQVSRTAQFARVHKTLKKHYKSVAPRADRNVLEHLIFACCLEDTRYEAAEEAFAALVHTFFDWNEVRVTSLSELSEVMARMPDPRVAGNRIKRILHGLFEANYSFDLEDKRKKNLGPTVKWLEKIEGTTPFTVAYVVQSALGGHHVPIDTGTMAVLRILDLVTDKDVSDGVVPGLERAIAKSKGVEFGSLLHQLGADYTANPFSPAVRDILMQIEPAAKDRFPQRRIPKAAAEPKAEGEPEALASGKNAAKADGKRKAAGEPEAITSGQNAAKAKGKRKAAGEPEAHRKLSPEHSLPGRETDKAHHAGKRSASSSPSEPAAEKWSAAEAGKKKSASEGLSKRKPR